MLGQIFNIQRFSVHDGHGIRTLVFMKGCPLSCKWCSNPEGLRSHPELGFIEKRCVRCGRCVEVCPLKAVEARDGRIYTNREICDSCGKCVKACLVEARKIIGNYVTVGEVLEEVEKDKPFYRRSKGGVTVSGGEPATQPEFVKVLLMECKKKLLDTCIETSGYVKWERLNQILEHTDFVYYDIKHMDTVRHRELTGVPNDLILENAKKILSSELRSRTVIRIPVVPGCNDSRENIKATAEFVTESGGKMIELLPYHGFGVAKYEQYNLVYELKDVKSPSKEDILELRELVLACGLREMCGKI